MGAWPMVARQLMSILRISSDCILRIAYFSSLDCSLAKVPAARMSLPPLRKRGWRGVETMSGMGVCMGRVAPLLRELDVVNERAVGDGGEREGIARRYGGLRR